MPPTRTDSKALKASSKKRKHVEPADKPKKALATKKSKAPVTKTKSSGVSQEDLLVLEEAIVESPKNYNKIVELQTHFQVRAPLPSPPPSPAF